jgi:hypothetical protein
MCDKLEANDHARFDRKSSGVKFNHFMKKSQVSQTTEAQSPVFPKTIHRLRPVSKTGENPESKKRPNTFSKSRDTREDRGARQMKTSHSSQTLPHAR